MIPIKKRAPRKPKAYRSRAYFGGGFAGTVHGMTKCKYCHVAIYAGGPFVDH